MTNSRFFMLAGMVVSAPHIGQPGAQVLGLVTLVVAFIAWWQE